MKLIKTVIVFSLVVFIGSCVITKTSKNYGIQTSYIGFIPARIAVIPCRDWPLKARYTKQIPSNISQPDLIELCKEFDKFILKSFSNQPFINGLTPELTKQLLSENGQEHMISEIPQIWNHDPSTCIDCNDSLSTYIHSIQSNSEWRVWLNNFSKSTRFADSILFPVVISAFERNHDDRGLLISERNLKLNILLIDTNNGRIQWIGQRSSSISNQTLRSGNESYPTFPEWTKLNTRVFAEGIWQGFPGRQQGF